MKRNSAYEKIARYSVNPCIYSLTQGSCPVWLNIRLQMGAEAVQAERLPKRKATRTKFSPRKLRLILSLAYITAQAWTLGRSALRVQWPVASSSS